MLRNLYPAQAVVAKQPTKERGQARVPDPETLRLARLLHIESLSSTDHNLNSDQLEVRKVGLPPLLLPAPKHFWAKARSSACAELLLAGEFVSQPVNSKDKLRVTLIRFELLSQPRHVNVNGARRDRRIIAPHFIQQLIA